MKKLAIAIATLPAATALHAQSNVTLYGLVDAGVEVVNHASATGGSVTRLTSGGQNTSRWGLRGSEDLGGGLKALFQLESGIFIDTGAVDTQLFRRQANVGLEGGFGRLIAGRSYTTAYDFILPFDPMGYAPAYSWATAGNATSAATSSAYGMTTAFDNILKYQGTFGGFKLGASYGFGEVAGDSSAGRRYVLGAGYAAGPFSAALTGERVNAPMSAAPQSKTTAYHLGLGWEINNAIALKAGARHFKQEPAAGGADLRANTYWAGVNWQATPALGLTAALYFQDQRNLATEADPKMLVLRAKYALSKRTDLYAVTAHARARNGQPVGLTRDVSPQGVTGFSDTQTGVMVGVQHRF
jgi:predicted porin